MPGRKTRDRGIKRAADHADRCAPKWTDEAKKLALEYLLEIGDRNFLCEDLREFAERKGFAQPPSKRAWGGVIVSLAHAGKIKKIGTSQVKNKTAHMANAAVWVANT